MEINPNEPLKKMATVKNNEAKGLQMRKSVGVNDYFMVCFILWCVFMVGINIGR